jgi:6-phosphofructo-2-kinase
MASAAIESTVHDGEAIIHQGRSPDSVVATSGRNTIIRASSQPIQHSERTTHTLQSTMHTLQHTIVDNHVHEALTSPAPSFSNPWPAESTATGPAILASPSAANARWATAEASVAHVLTESWPADWPMPANPDLIARPGLSRSRSSTSSASSSFSRSRTSSRSRKSSQLSDLAKSLLMSTAVHSNSHVSNPDPLRVAASGSPALATLAKDDAPRSMSYAIRPVPVRQLSRNGGGVGAALSDTPEPSNPATPRISVHRHNSSGSTPRMRPTTLDIPGLTRSKVSPDGKIAKRDVGSKLIIVMVGLPARGKSYITKKLTRYMNWLQHDTQIFNVGERRRVVANHSPENNHLPDLSGPQAAARALMRSAGMPIPTLKLPEAGAPELNSVKTPQQDEDASEHTANFFDPNNKRAAELREQVAMETLDELLDYVLDGEGAVGILDATNSTIPRRKKVMEHIRLRDTSINVLFIESMCEDSSLLEANMRLKLSGPDYKDKDPVASLADFKQRVAIYEKNYVPLGEYEQKQNYSYIKFIDVGKQVILYNVKGFLSTHVGHYLFNFNLAPRQIWITRHGESEDNVSGKIGGDSSLSPNGAKYGHALTKFIEEQRKEWEVHQRVKEQNVHLPPIPGDHTPPNPHIDDGVERAFCVWTSMLRRSIESASDFTDEIFDVKEFRMLDEINAGFMEGMTYDEIKTKHFAEFQKRQKDKLSYRYPGPGGESYLDVINRVRQIIVELERMTDHCLIITHRSVARILLAYFCNLPRDEVATLDCPLGMLYSLEPVSFDSVIAQNLTMIETLWCRVQGVSV